MHPGALIRYRLRLMGIPFDWLTRITEWNPPESFVDEQLAGPYKTWVHRHRFLEVPGRHAGGRRGELRAAVVPARRARGTARGAPGAPDILVPCAARSGSALGV